MLRWLERWSRVLGVSPDHTAADVVKFVRACGGLHWWAFQDNCVAQSLTLFALMNRADAPLDVAFGVAAAHGLVDGVPQLGRRHIWLEQDGVAVYERDPLAPYTVQMRYRARLLASGEGNGALPSSHAWRVRHGHRALERGLGGEDEAGGAGAWSGRRRDRRTGVAVDVRADVAGHVRHQRGHHALSLGSVGTARRGPRRPGRANRVGAAGRRIDSARGGRPAAGARRGELAVRLGCRGPLGLVAAASGSRGRAHEPLDCAAARRRPGPAAGLGAVGRRCRRGRRHVSDAARRQPGQPGAAGARHDRHPGLCADDGGVAARAALGPRHASVPSSTASWLAALPRPARPMS